MNKTNAFSAPGARRAASLARASNLANGLLAASLLKGKGDLNSLKVGANGEGSGGLADAGGGLVGLGLSMAADARLALNLFRDAGRRALINNRAGAAQPARLASRDNLRAVKPLASAGTVRELFASKCHKEFLAVSINHDRIIFDRPRSYKVPHFRARGRQSAGQPTTIYPYF